jgi:4-alpha-glucanotransferase
MQERPSLARLASLCGITSGYHDISGAWHPTSDETAERLLAAMGIAASTEEEAARSVAEREAAAGPRLEAGVAHEIAYPAPPACAPLNDRIGEDRAWGVYANLYTVRARSRFGIGDFGALAKLADWVAEAGGDFVAVNPLHTLAIESGSGCPYAPASRLFTEPLYLDAAALPILNGGGVPSLAHADALANAVPEEAVIDYGACWRATRAQLWEVFRRERAADPDAAARLAAFRAGEGVVLTDYATFRAARERFDSDWRRWPAELQRHDSDATAAFRNENMETVEFFCWLAMLADRRLGEIAAGARAAGLRLGLLLDVALGSPHDSADVWSHPEAFALGASIGAPPDDIAPQGQNWCLAPLNPLRIADAGLAFQRELYRRNLRHAGAMRLDHAMGLVRQFWFPADDPAAEGAYVLYPGELTMGVLAEASRASGTAVVGEDLGTVPDGFREWMIATGALRTLVARFERDWEGGFREAGAYAVEALATANTHDLPPLVGWLAGRDLEVRRRLGFLHDHEEDERRRELENLARRLRDEGCLSRDAELTAGNVTAAVARFLARTPSRLVALALDDLGGEPDAVNHPGVDERVWPSWVRRMQRTVEELRDDDAVGEILAGLAQARPRSRMSCS